MNKYKYIHSFYLISAQFYAFIGPVPTEIGLLCDLNLLDVSYNYFSGKNLRYRILIHSTVYFL